MAAQHGAATAVSAAPRRSRRVAFICRRALAGQVAGVGVIAFGVAALTIIRRNQRA
jgi:hypothetical protein